MGFSRKRLRSGKWHYTAYYKDLKGAERSAGTFTEPVKPSETSGYLRTLW